jgi:hypothetical protein
MNAQGSLKNKSKNPERPRILRPPEFSENRFTKMIICQPYTEAVVTTREDILLIIVKAES